MPNQKSVDIGYTLFYNKKGMKEIRFNQDKNTKLKLIRGIGFDEVSKIIKKNKILKVIDNPNKKKYQNQKLLLIQIKKSIFVVPFVEEKNYIFLKTIYPSHKYTKKYFIKLKIKK